MSVVGTQPFHYSGVEDERVEAGADTSQCPLVER